MKRVILLLTLIIIVLLFSLSGCSEQTGNIVRHDITTNDLDYFFSGKEPRLADITENDMVNALGLPHRMFYLADWFLYEYSFDRGNIVFIIDESSTNKGFRNIYIELNAPNEEVKEFNIGEKSIDIDKYAMNIRRDIDIKELDFICDKTTSYELQQILAAPYTLGSGILKDPGINVFIYKLKKGDLLFVTYGESGEVAGAWVEDNEGKELDEIVACK